MKTLAQYILVLTKLSSRAGRMYFFLVLFELSVVNVEAQGNFCFSGLETANFGIIDLSTSAGSVWQTDRLAQPGYFSAMNDAAYIGANDVHNINGYVKKYGNQSFVFPIGTGSDLRMLGISAPSSITDVYATAWMPGDPTSGTDLTMPHAGSHNTFAVSSPLVAVSTIGQWDWQVGDNGNLGDSTTGTGDGLTITVSIPDMTKFAFASDLRLAGWNGTNWIDLSGAATATGNTEDSKLTGTMATGITAIAIASISVDITTTFRLTGSVTGNCGVELRWKAFGSSEINRFSIERSYDGILFGEVSVLKADRFPDENNYISTVSQTESAAYYRLKIINDNGSYRYSNTVAFQIDCILTDKIMIYPNPVTVQQSTHLRIVTSYRGPVSILLFSALGQQLAEVKNDVTAGITILPVNVARFQNGVYYIRVIKRNGSRIGETLELIKQ